MPYPKYYSIKIYNCRVIFIKKLEKNIIYDIIKLTYIYFLKKFLILIYKDISNVGILILELLIY